MNSINQTKFSDLNFWRIEFFAEGKNMWKIYFSNKVEMRESIQIKSIFYKEKCECLQIYLEFYSCCSSEFVTV